MNAQTDDEPAEGAPAPPVQLVLPRRHLDQCAIDAWHAAADAARQHTTPRLWHAAMTLLATVGLRGEAVIRALPGPLQPGPPVRRHLPSGIQGARAAKTQSAGTQHLGPVPTAFLLLMLAPPDEAPPAPGGGGSSEAWDRWVARWAPDYRLATPALQPDIVVLWMRADGLCRAALRPGQQWRALLRRQDGGDPVDAGNDWQDLAGLQLPGAEMLDLWWRRQRGLAGTNPEGVPAQAATNDDEGRYSRLSPGLGPKVLQQLQACTVALIGAGRAGSVLATSLARMGCSLLVLDPDSMSPHSMDGDLPALMEGQPKVTALRRQLRGLMRPGATLDARMLSVASPVAGALLSQVDIIVCAADNDAAALWADAWGLAMHKPRLVVASGLHAHGAEADLRLLVPGGGCLSCTGGFSLTDELPSHLAAGDSPPRPPSGQRQRVGSIRSWNLMATHTALRMAEHLVAGRVRNSLFRHLVERPDGGLVVQDWTPEPERRRGCALCICLEGAGPQAVTAELLQQAVRLAAASPRASS